MSLTWPYRSNFLKNLLRDVITRTPPPLTAISTVMKAVAKANAKIITKAVSCAAFAFRKSAGQNAVGGAISVSFVRLFLHSVSLSFGASLGDSFLVFHICLLCFRVVRKARPLCTLN